MEMEENTVEESKESLSPSNQSQQEEKEGEEFLSKENEEKEIQIEEKQVEKETEEIQSNEKEDKNDDNNGNIELEMEEEKGMEETEKKRKRLKKNKKEKKSKKEKKEKRKGKEEKSKKKRRGKEKEKEKKVSDDPFEEDVFGEDAEQAQDGEEKGEEEEEEQPVKQMNEFDLACERLKKKRAKKLSGEEIVSLKDDAKELFEKMETAYRRDRDDNEQGRPALNKIKMLDEISNQFMTKQYPLLRAFVEEGLLKILRGWIEPYKDRSLPNMKVRETVLNILVGFPAQWTIEEEGREDFLEVQDLKDSGIGQAVMLLAKHPSETAANKKMAKQLIERWSHSIFKTGANYSHKEIEERETNSPKITRENASTSSYNDRLDISTILEKTKDEKSEGFAPKSLSSYHARIPEKMKLDFAVMPKSQVDPKRKVAPKNNRFEKTFQKLKTGTGTRGSNISIEGRSR